jgi:hypothetical protein
MNALAVAIVLLVLAAALVAALLNDRRPTDDSEPDWEDGE